MPMQPGNKVYKRPKNFTTNKGEVFKGSVEGPRLLLTGGEYSVGDYKKAWVATGKGNDGYTKTQVYVAMTFPHPENEQEKYFVTKIAITSTVPWGTISNSNRTARKFIKERDEECRNVIKAFGDASRKLAKYFKNKEDGDQTATLVFSVVCFCIFVYYRDYEYASGNGANDDNSESTA